MENSRKVPLKTPPVWLIVLLLISGSALWLREVCHPVVADIMPFQLAAYFHAHGEDDFMYTSLANLDQWKARSDEVALKLGAPRDSNPYCHPPFCAVLLVPFADFPAMWWRNMLLVINHLLIGVLAWIMLRAAGTEMTARWFMFAVAVLLCSFPLSWAVSIGQVGPILVVGVWLGLLALQRGHETRGGVVLGVFTAIKLFPIAFIVVPFLHRQYRAVAVWLSTTLAIYGLSFLFLGTRIHVQWWESLRDFIFRVDTFKGNQSMGAWIARLSIPPERIPWLVIGDPFVDSIRVVCGLLLFLTTAYVLWKCRKIERHGMDTAQAGLLVLALFLATAVFWIHYLIYVLPVLAFAVYHEWFMNGNRWGRVLTLAASILIMGKLTHFYGGDIFGRIFSGSYTIGAFLLWLWCALWLANETKQTVTARTELLSQ
jgi:alpha-1,2-mannosyltransferase